MVVVGGFVGGVVVGGAVVGVAVVGVAVVGVAVVGGVDVTGGDLATVGAFVGEGVVLPLAGVLVAGGDVVVVPVLELGVAPPVEVGVDADFGADDFPLERTANHSFSTPCPVASPPLESLTKWYSA